MPVKFPPSLVYFYIAGQKAGSKKISLSLTLQFSFLQPLFQSWAHKETIEKYKFSVVLMGANLNCAVPSMQLSAKWPPPLLLGGCMFLVQIEQTYFVFVKSSICILKTQTFTLISNVEKIFWQISSPIFFIYWDLGFL